VKLTAAAAAARMHKPAAALRSHRPDRSGVGRELGGVAELPERPAVAGDKIPELVVESLRKAAKHK
jgi:hypothetical protein